MRRKVLSTEQIQEAKDLRKKQGFTKRDLADYFGVGVTTIWDNIYAEKKRVRRYLVQSKRSGLYASIQSVTIIVNEMRQEGYTSLEISNGLEMPLEEVNYIFSHF